MAPLVGRFIAGSSVDIVSFGYSLLHDGHPAAFLALLVAAVVLGFLLREASRHFERSPVVRRYRRVQKARRHRGRRK